MNSGWDKTTGTDPFTRQYLWDAGTSGWALTNETRFIYDVNVVIQERDSNNVAQVTYTRGLDLSGSLQGAGGIGGLLARTDTNGCAFYHADGNGNVTSLMDTNQYIVARYLFDPFGKLLGKWGTLADANVYRFSSKEWDANSEFYYYLYRSYNPNLQRWLNRDPIEEQGGINLYEFVKNGPSLYVDLWGLDKNPGCVAQCKQQWLVDCFNTQNIVDFGLGGGAIGAGLQGLNKTAVIPGKGGNFIRPPSGDYTSWTRKCFGRAGRAIGRTSVGGVAAIGAGVGMLALQAKCWSGYEGCKSGCPDVTPPSNSKCPTPPPPPPDDCN